MIARFVYDIKLEKVPHKGFLEYIGLPQVDSWEQLTDEQIKKYARGRMFNDYNDANEHMGNYPNDKVLLLK